MQGTQMEEVVGPAIEPIIILVNGRKREWRANEISFRQVVELAFGSYDDDPNISYTVTYSKGPGRKPQGILVEGQSAGIHEGMSFNVTRTDKS